MALVMNRNYSYNTSHHLGPTPLSRSSSTSSTWNELLGGYSNSSEHYNSSSSAVMMEKRQLFLRSYQFCRKRTLTERIKGSLIRAKKVMWLRLRSARKIRRLVWSRLRYAFYCRRRRRFLRLINHNHHNSSTCTFW